MYWRKSAICQESVSCSPLRPSMLLSWLPQCRSYAWCIPQEADLAPTECPIIGPQIMPSWQSEPEFAETGDQKPGMAKWSTMAASGQIELPIFLRMMSQISHTLIAWYESWPWMASLCYPLPDHLTLRCGLYSCPVFLWQQFVQAKMFRKNHVQYTAHIWASAKTARWTGGWVSL